jgi:hypothetical protein
MANLWVCHRCKQIGSGFEAGRHVGATGHPVEELSAEMSAAVRSAQSRQHPTAADFIAFAAFRKKAAQDLERSGRGPG